MEESKKYLQQELESCTQKRKKKIKFIDIWQLKQLILEDLLEVYIKKGNIFIKDVENGECVCIGEVDKAIENGDKRDYRGRL